MKTIVRDAFSIYIVGVLAFFLGGTQYVVCP